MTDLCSSPNRSNRLKARQEIDRLLERGDSKGAYKILPRAIDISQDMAKQLVDKLIENDLDYIVAPYEADAQMAYLVRNGFAHYAISEDSDLILYGCDYVLYKLDKDGNGELLQHSKVLDCLGDDHGLDFRKFKRMCILSGCDYLSSLNGIGLKKAQKFFATCKKDNIERALPELPKVLNMKKLVVPEEYVRKFVEAENVFDHQLVYCPREKKLRPFTDYGENSGEVLDYAGSYFDEDLALNFVFGNVNFKTMEIFDSTIMEKLKQKYINSPTSIWCSLYKLDDPDRFDKILEILAPCYVRPDELNGKRKLEGDFNGLAGFPKKDKRRKTAVNSSRSVVEDDEVIVEGSYRSSFRSETMISSQEENGSLEMQVEVKSRFFEQNGGESDVQRIKQSKQAIRDKLSKLYLKPSASQMSSDSGFESQPSNSQEISQEAS